MYWFRLKQKQVEMIVVRGASGDGAFLDDGRAWFDDGLCCMDTGMRYKNFVKTGVRVHHIYISRVPELHSTISNFFKKIYWIRTQTVPVLGTYSVQGTFAKIMYPCFRLMVDSRFELGD